MIGHQTRLLENDDLPSQVEAIECTFTVFADLIASTLMILVKIVMGCIHDNLYWVPSVMPYPNLLLPS